mgnify:CR=1 FL=1
MIGVDLIETIIENTILTAYLKRGPAGDEHTVNLLIVGNTGTGKSRLISQFSNVPRIKVAAEITFAALMNRFGLDLINGNLNHLFFSDLAPMVHKGSLGATLHEMSLFSQLIEEGISDWQTMGGRGFHSPATLQCGIIACATIDTYEHQLVPLSKTNGFLSRFLVVSYRHSEVLQRQIRTAIHQSVSMNHQRAGLRIPIGKVEVQLPEAISRSLSRPLDSTIPRGPKNPSLVDRALGMGDTYGYRTQSQLRNLLKANALRNHRFTVEDEDYLELVQMGNFFGPDMAEL